MTDHKLKILYIGSSSAHLQGNTILNNDLAAYDVSFVNNHIAFSARLTEFQPDLIVAEYFIDPSGFIVSTRYEDQS